MDLSKNYEKKAQTAVTFQANEDRVENVEKELATVQESFNFMKENMLKQINLSVRKMVLTTGAASPPKKSMTLSKNESTAGLESMKSEVGIETLTKTSMKTSMARHTGTGDLDESDFIQIMKTKADKTELTQLSEQKANKFDFEQQMKALDIMHRQMHH